MKNSKQWLAGLALALPMALIGAQAMAADVGVSVTVGQPGFYGRIDIGPPPPPAAFIYAQPVIIQQLRGPAYPPLYLRVPPGYERHWDKHCRRYDACGRPVYFVRDDWYRHQYVERRDGYRGDRDGRGDRGDRDGDRGHGRDRDHERGNGHGNGNGHGRGNDRD